MTSDAPETVTPPEADGHATPSSPAETPPESAPSEVRGSDPGPGAGRRLLSTFKGGARLALLLRVAPETLGATPGTLALLALCEALLNCALSFFLAGRGGSFAYSALPSFFFHLPLLLFLGYLAGRELGRPELGLAVPAALVALSLPLELSHGFLERLVQFRRFEWLGGYLEAPHYYRFFWWWSASGLLFLLRVPGVRFGQRLRLALFFVLLIAPLWYFPRADLWVSASESGGESGELHLTERVLSAQARLLDGQLAGLVPGVPGESNLYFVGFAGDGSQDVFLKELLAAEQLFVKRFGADRRSIVLANNPQTAATLPFATATNLNRALARLGRIMNRDNDVLVLFLTSHGSREHELTVSNQPLELEQLTPELVRDMLKKSGIRYKVLIVSACYAGGYIEPLKDDQTMIITAADAQSESFGCGFGEKFTWFGEAFLDMGLRNTYSFTKAFDRARETIRHWEDEQGETPSNPQIWVGKEIEHKLSRLERELKEAAREP